MSPQPPETAPDQLRLELSCPKCGGPFVVEDEEVVSATCAYCHSLLILSHPDREEIYIADGHTDSGEKCLEICIGYRIQAQRAEIVSRLRDPEGKPPPEFVIENRLRAFEARLRSRAALHEAHLIHAPYWHVTGKIVHGILGRDGDVKQTRVRAYLVEHTEPGYDTGTVNLRDRGLRLARARVRPLTLKDARGQTHFVPWLSVPERSFREVEKWRTRRLDPRIQPMIQDGRFLFGQRILVYRPYWLVKVTLDSGPRWVLIDGSFSTVAGYPSEVETGAILGSCVGNPLPEEGASYLNIAATGSRCPDCGAEQSFEPHALIQVCTNCQLALELEAAAVMVFRYSHARSPRAGDRAHYLPFWRFPFRARIAGGPVVETLEEYASAVFPLGLPPRFGLRGRHLWIPAFRLLGTRAGDATFKDLVELFHATPPPAQRGKVPLGTRSAFWSCSLSEQHARELARYALVALHPKISAARLNNLIFKRTVQDLELEAGSCELVMVPFSLRKEALVVDGTRTRVPMLLLRGGPPLEAQRLTVQRAAGAMG